MDEHKMTIEEVENKLKVLSHIVDDDDAKAIREARIYLSELQHLKDRMNLQIHNTK